MRLVATGGIIGIAVVVGTVLVSQDVAGWIVGLVVGLTSVILPPALVVAAALAAHHIGLSKRLGAMRVRVSSCAARATGWGRGS